MSFTHSPRKITPAHVRGARLQVPVPLAEVSRHQLLHQRLRVLVKVLREVDLASQDLLVDTHRLLVAERRLAHNHLVDQDAQRPPVHRLPVAWVPWQFLGSVGSVSISGGYSKLY